MPLTLEERERFAYIEGRTDEAAVLQAAIEQDESARAEITKLTDEANELDDRVSKLTGQVEDLETEVADRDDKIADLQIQIHEAGIDLL